MKFRWKRYHFRLWVFAFTVGTEEYYPKFDNANDVKGLQILNHYYRLKIINIGKLSAYYCRIWEKRISDHTYVLHFFICKGTTSFSKTTQVNEKSRLLRTSVKEKRDICWCGKNWVITQSLNTDLSTFTVTRYLKRNKYFYSYIEYRKLYRNRLSILLLLS